MNNGSYTERLKLEIENYEKALDQGGLSNSIPEIFSYWATRYLSPRFRAVFGHHDISAIFASELKANCKVSGKAPYRILSLGSGDCRTEIEIAKLLAADGIDFRFICTDVNRTVISQAKNICRDAGMEGRFEHHLADLNVDFPDLTFDAAMANHSLHHFVGLENIFSNVKRRLRFGGVFIVNDMIGRNGHMRWPEALPFVEQIWNYLPRHKRFNNHAKCYEDWSFVNYDCASGGDFEGVRAQDIFPLLLQQFAFTKFVGFGNLMDIFIDRAYGPNFAVSDEADRRLIDYLERLTVI